jgi:hypothetical protein
LCARWPLPTSLLRLLVLVLLVLVLLVLVLVLHLGQELPLVIVV